MNMSPEESEGFGGFSLGSLNLALPMAALREVLPCTDLADLPCPAACVIGGVSLRGVIVPVIDLRILLGRPAPAAESRNVVLMVCGGKILGLLADYVTGIFELPKQPAIATERSAVGSAIFLRGVIRPDNLQVTSLLSPDGLARLPQVPLADDPEPQPKDLNVSATSSGAPEALVPMMLMNCGVVPLAVDAMLVHATLSDPIVEPCALNGEHCRGVIDYNGYKIPSIDLQSLCGFGRLTVSRGIQAFVVELPAGYVAFLISNVIDVINTLPHHITPVPAFALPQPRLFAGSLPVSELSPVAADRAGQFAHQYLVLSAAGLSSCNEVVALSSVNVLSAGTAERQLSHTDANAPARCLMITYRLGIEYASQLDQIAEILSYEARSVTFAAHGLLLGVMASRGRSIPLVCLSRLVGNLPQPQTANTCVLVVESQGELIGFVINALGTIDQAQWEHAVPGLRATYSTKREIGTNHQQHLALMGAGPSERVVPVIDLLQLAVRLQRETENTIH